MKTCLALSLLALAALPAAASDVHFGLIGVTPFETARLNAFCDGSVTPIPCDVTFEFHDANGNILKQVSMTVQPETSGFADFSLGAATVSFSRVEIEPCWKVLRGTAQPSLELFDNFTHRTRMLVTYSQAAMPRAGVDVDFGALAITRFDKARMSATCEDDGSSCDVSFEFHDGAGRTVKAMRTTIAPGSAAFLDLSFADTSAAGGRVTIAPCWTVAAGAAVLNVQTIDTFTGLTITHAFPANLVPAVQ